MFRKKVYGQSRIDHCPFCGRQATAKNSQGILVCRQHKSAVLNEMKCVCGETLDILEGKYGPFFNCMTCGPINTNKVFEMNEVKDVSKQRPGDDKPPLSRSERSAAKPREISITTDDVEYFS